MKTEMLDRNHWYFDKNSRRRIRQVAAFVLLDQGIILLAYITTYSVRLMTFFAEYIDRLAPTMVVSVLILILLFIFGVYQRIWEQSSGHEIIVIIKPVVLATVLALIIDLLINPRPLPLSVIIVGNFLSLCGFIAVRYRSRLFTGASWRWKAIWSHEFPKVRTRVLIVGAGEAGQALTWRLKHRSPDKQYEVVGFIDDDPAKQGRFVEGCPVLGTRADIKRIVQNRKVDLIVVAIHKVTGAVFREILTACEETKAIIKVVPDLFALVNDKTHVPNLRDVQPEDLIGRSTQTRYQDLSFDPLIEKVICITGAAGSIGSELTRQIVQYQPRKVILIDNNESGLYDLVTEVAATWPKVELVSFLADITLPETIDSIFDIYRPQVVFHAAAYKHVYILEAYPHEALRVNIQGTWNIANLACRYGVERFVLISTDKAIRPISVMGASKRICELLLQAIPERQYCTTLFCAVRFGNVIGSRGSVVPTFNKQIDNGGPVTVTHPDMTRYFMSTLEAVNLIIHAACLTEGKDIFMLRMGEVVRIKELAERMIRMRGLRPYEDIEIAFTGIRPGEKLHEELVNGDEESLPTLHPHIVKIQSLSNQFDANLFFNSLEKLLQEPPRFSTDVMNSFMKIIQSEYT